MQRVSGPDAAFLYGETPSWHMHVSSILMADPSTAPHGFTVERLKAQHREAHRARPPVPLAGGGGALRHRPAGVRRGPGLRHRLPRPPHRRARSPAAPPAGRAGRRPDLLQARPHAGPCGSSGSSRASRTGRWPSWPRSTTPSSTASRARTCHRPAGPGARSRRSRRRRSRPRGERIPSGARAPRPGGACPTWSCRGARPASAPSWRARDAPCCASWPVPAAGRSRSRRRGPRSTARITPHRRFAYTTLSLATVKAVKNAFGVKLNDVVLAVCAGALRAYLQERDELPEQPLIAQVPVSTRTEDDEATTWAAGGGRCSPRSATHIEDPVEPAAGHPRGHPGGQGDAAGAGGRQDHGPDRHHVARPRRPGRPHVHRGPASERRTPPVFNLIISNVPGPPFDLYMAGARITGHLPDGPAALRGGAQHHRHEQRHRLDFGVLTCRESVPDPWIIDRWSRGARRAGAAPPSPGRRPAWPGPADRGARGGGTVELELVARPGRCRSTRWPSPRRWWRRTCGRRALHDPASAVARPPPAGPTASDTRMSLTWRWQSEHGGSGVEMRYDAPRPAGARARAPRLAARTTATSGSTAPSARGDGQPGHPPLGSPTTRRRRRPAGGPSTRGTGRRCRGRPRPARPRRASAPRRSRPRPPATAPR